MSPNLWFSCLKLKYQYHNKRPFATATAGYTAARTSFSLFQHLSA